MVPTNCLRNKAIGDFDIGVGHEHTGKQMVRLVSGKLTEAVGYMLVLGKGEMLYHQTEGLSGGSSVPMKHKPYKQRGGILSSTCTP